MATKLTKRVRRVTEEKHLPYNEKAVKILGVNRDGSITTAPNEGRHSKRSVQKENGHD